MTEENINSRMHPYYECRKDLKSEKVIVIDDVTDAPVYNEACITDDLIIAICHKGRMIADNEDMVPRDVGIVMPKQIVHAKRVSNDFVETIIVISQETFDELKHQYQYTRYTSFYRVNPLTHLTEEQYNFVNNVTETIRFLSKSESKYRDEMLLQQLSILLNVLGEFRIKNNPEEKISAPKTMLFNKFYESITEHYHEAHEVIYYAKMFGLSPKYFANIIKAETGVSATRWITDFVIIKAKLLLDTRRDLSLQQVSMMLGFSEQASFSRYFKTHTGMTASAYRDRNGRILTP